MEFISLFMVKAKYHLFQQETFTHPDSPILQGYFLSLSSFLVPIWKSASLYSYFLSQKCLLHLAFLQTYLFWSLWFYFLFGWFNYSPHLFCWQLHFSLLSLASSSSSAFDLRYPNQQTLQPLHLESVLREVSHSTCLTFCLIFASSSVILSVSLITTKMDT